MKKLSLQLMPTFFTESSRKCINREYDAFMGGGGPKVGSNRITLFCRVFLTMFVDRTKYKTTLGLPIHSQFLSLGVDIEIGGHVFQPSLYQSKGMIEKAVLLDRQSGTWGLKISFMDST